MAQFIGTAGEFQESRTLQRLGRVVAIILAGMAVYFFALGFIAAKHSAWLSLVALATVVVSVRPLKRSFMREMAKIRAESQGASGERQLVPYLRELPDTYTVISDLDFADSYGNIDHLVIGPTGLYAIDVKNWKGTVASDGKGELLLNGRPTDKPQVRNFTRRAMELKDRLVALTKLDPYIRALFVFPSTHIDAKWGTTGHVHCLYADQLAGHIIAGKSGRAIAVGDMQRLVSAAKALKDLAYSGTGKKVLGE